MLYKMLVNEYNQCAQKPPSPPPNFKLFLLKVMKSFRLKQRAEYQRSMCQDAALLYAKDSPERRKFGEVMSPKAKF